MDYSSVFLKNKLSIKKTFLPIQHVHVALCITFIIILLFLCSNSSFTNIILADIPLKISLNNPSTYEDTRYSLLAYNFRVKQNIIEALTSNEKMSEEIAPFEIFRRHYMTAPDYQLSLCPISKSMSTVAMNIFCYLYDPISFVKNNQSISTSIWAKRLCKNINEFKSYDDLASKIGNKVYHTIAVIRDPLSRFISGYLDKCVRPVRKCFGCEIEDLRCVLTRLKMMLATKPKIITFEVNPYALELLHMAPQTWYCEMRKVFENMIFVKYGQSGLEHERMVRDLTVALNFTKVPPDQIDYIEKELKQNSRTSHSTEKMDLRKVFFEELTTRSDLQTLFWSIYENDYKIFDFQFLK